MLSPPRAWFQLVCIVMLAVVVGPLWAEVPTYKVKSGDTLYRIALTHKTSVSQLKALNGIENERNLRVGQVLKLTGGSTSAKSPASKSAASASKSSSSSSRIGVGKRVVIDPGHGGMDRGAVWGGVRESHLTMKLANKLESILKERGYATTMTRRSDTFVSLARRASIANSYRNAIFVSVHFNATRETWVRGAETYYAGSAGRSLAQAIHREMVNRLKLRNRGVRLARFTVLMQTKCPAVLVECGFLSNSSERSRCVTTSYLDTAALAIAEGIRRYRWH